MSLAAGKRDHKEQNPKQLTRPGEFLVVPLDTCFPFVLPMPQVASSDAGLHAEHAQPKFLRFLVSNRKLVPVRDDYWKLYRKML